MQHNLHTLAPSPTSLVMPAQLVNLMSTPLLALLIEVPKFREHRGEHRGEHRMSEDSDPQLGDRRSPMIRTIPNFGTLPQVLGRRNVEVLELAIHLMMIVLLRIKPC
jgi:hypothetical protein